MSGLHDLINQLINDERVDGDAMHDYFVGKMQDALSDADIAPRSLDQEDDE